jgi:hypothetical protein
MPRNSPPGGASAYLDSLMGILNTYLDSLMGILKRFPYGSNRKINIFTPVDFSFKVYYNNNSK